MCCRMNGCEKPVYIRGLCERHYAQAWRLKKVAPKKFAKLVEAGIILPAYAGGKEIERLAETLDNG